MSISSVFLLYFIQIAKVSRYTVLYNYVNSNKHLHNRESYFCAQQDNAHRCDYGNEGSRVLPVKFIMSPRVIISSVGYCATV